MFINNSWMIRSLRHDPKKFLLRRYQSRTSYSYSQGPFSLYHPLSTGSVVCVRKTHKSFVEQGVDSWDRCYIPILNKSNKGSDLTPVSSVQIR